MMINFEIDAFAKIRCVDLVIDLLFQLIILIAIFMVNF